MCRTCQGWNLDDNKKPIRLYKCFNCKQHADKEEDIVHTTCTPSTQIIEKNPYLNEDGSQNLFMEYQIEIIMLLFVVFILICTVLFIALLNFVSRLDISL